MNRFLLTSFALLVFSPFTALAQENQSAHQHHAQAQETQEEAKPQTSAPPVHDHAQHQESETDALPRTPIPPITEADRRAGQPPAAHAMHGDGVHSFVLFDRLEWSEGDHGAFAWEVDAWLGSDTDRLWLRSEGEAVRNASDHAELELLYGHSVSPWWDVLVGLRHQRVGRDSCEMQPLSL